MPRLKTFWFVVFFFVALAPWAASFALFYPDEAHYLNGALVMRETGDYLIPRTDEGMPRLRKPAMAYWATAGSFAVLGVNAFAARLPFLLAGCGVVWLTASLAGLVSGRRDAAVLAALMVAASPPLILGSIRAIPDVLQCFFLLLAWRGFIGRWRGEGIWAVVTGYLGVALAVATKGLLGLALVVFVGLVALSSAEPRVHFRKLMHLPSLVLAAVVGGGWFACVAWQDSSALWTEFWGDQVGRKMGGLQTPVIFPAFVIVTVAAGLPWTLLLAEAAWHNRQNAPGFRNFAGNPLLILAGWCALMLLIFGLSSNPSARYALPATPLIAVLAAHLALREGTARGWFAVKGVVLIAFGLLTVLTLGGSGVLFASKAAGAAWAVLIAGALLAVALIWGRRRAWLSNIEAAAMALLAAVSVAFLVLRPLVLPDDATQIADKLAKPNDQSGPVAFIGRNSAAARLRVATGGRFKIVRFDRYVPTVTNFPVVIVARGDRPELEDQGYQFEEPARVAGIATLRQLGEAMLGGGSLKDWRTNAAPVFIARRP